MTPTERDKLVVLAGGRVEQSRGRWVASHYYHFEKESYPSSKWRPESSLDDCRPLLEKIERQELHKAFLDQLVVLVDHGTQLCDNPCYAIAWRMLSHCKPTNIVEAFVRTMKVNHGC